MPATPTFIADLDTLKAQLRLSAVDTGDAAAVLDAAVNEVRLGFYSRLGSTLVAELQALTPGDPATTTDELKRLRAENVEQLWVRKLLLQRLPSLFFQGAGVARHAWNQEGITREAAGSDLRRMIADLERLIEEGFAHLAGTTTGLLAVTVPVPDETPQRPGASIAPSLVKEVL